MEYTRRKLKKQIAVEIRISLSEETGICRIVYLRLKKLRSNGHRLHNQVIHNNAWLAAERKPLFIQILV